MDLKVIFRCPRIDKRQLLLLRDFRPLRKLTAFFIEFVIFRNFLEQYKYGMLLDCTLEIRGGGGTCYAGVSGDVPFSRVYFCSKILEQDINFEEKL